MLIRRNMKEKSIEKFFMLPFFIGCGSESSVEVTTKSQLEETKNSSQKIRCGSESSVEVTTKSQLEETKNSSQKIKRQEGEESPLSVKMKRFWAMTRPRFSQNVQRLKMHFKGFSQLFAQKSKVEEEKMEIEIGYPTDVKHLTHIGWDGATTINPIKGWENLEPPEIVSFPTISIKQFELAMAAQTGETIDVNTNNCTYF